MIGKLRGIVDTIRTDHVLLDVNGVGYKVFVSTKVLEQLTAGVEVTLYIETHVREDHIHLFGFINDAEQEYFNVLTSVQGVGNRMALAVLSVFTPHDVGNIILAQDKTAFTRVSGIGKRIAERIVTELKSKLPSFDTSASDTPSQAPTPSSVSVMPDQGHHAMLHDAVSALEHLGYGRADAHKAAYAASQEGADSLDALIKQGLKKLAG